MKYILSPSLLAADFYNLENQLKVLEKENVPYLHLDVMDGKFVPSISFGMPVIQALRKKTNFFFDVHLMIEEPIRYVNEFKEAGADLITVHAEACNDLKLTIAMIHAAGLKAAVSINPETPLDPILETLDMVDMVLLMTVHPGFGGQKFIPEVREKIKDLATIKAMRNYQFDIEVDGGINKENLADVLSDGANVFVAGSAIFKEDIAQNVRDFNQIIKDYQDEN